MAHLLPTECLMKTGGFKMKKLICLFLIFVAWQLGAQQAIIIDHTCTDTSKIPAYWLEKAKELTIHYAHTSHGSQINTGLYALENMYPVKYSYARRSSSSSAGLPAIEVPPAIRMYDGNPPETYIQPDDYWSGTSALNRTRAVVSTGDYDYSMWSWCGQVSYEDNAYIDEYLAAITLLESEFPTAGFIYMTGHTDGSGLTGDLNLHNNMIRTYCINNNKILFDFADIESYDPSGNYFLDIGCDDQCNYDSGNWADEWIAAHPAHELTLLANDTNCESCAHSHRLNCVLKARAFWWMMARLAGWDGVSTGSITVSSPNGGESLLPGSLHNITWTAPGVNGNLKITLWKDGAFVGIIGANITPGSGSFPWTVGAYDGGTAPEGTGYTIKIKEKGTTVSDTSDGAFNICTLTVTSPNGGESLARGAVHNITWNAPYVPGSLKITLWKDSVLVGVVAYNIPAASGSFPWTIGAYAGGTAALGAGYTIKIKEKGTTVSDISDSSFEIFSNASVTVTSPNGGESLPRGATHNITWDAQNVFGTLKITLWKDGIVVGVIADNVSPAPSSYSWTVGSSSVGTADAGNGYTIKIKVKGVAVADVSDASFDLTD